MLSMDVHIVSNTECPIWHYSLGRSVGHLVKIWPHWDLSILEMSSGSSTQGQITYSGDRYVLLLPAKTHTNTTTYCRRLNPQAENIILKIIWPRDILHLEGGVAMGSHPLVVSLNVAGSSLPHMVLLQHPLKGAAEMLAWRKYSGRIGYHPLGCNVFIKSETPVWCCVPRRKGTWAQGWKGRSKSGSFTIFPHKWPTGGFCTSCFCHSKGAHSC